MSDQDPPQEPSMEEILASIRRIISEDGGGDVSPIRSVVEESAIETETGEREIRACNESPGDVHDDPLELTHEIQEDGTVVDLNTGKTVHTNTESGETLELKSDTGGSNKEDKLLDDSIISLETGVESAASLSALAAALEKPQRSPEPGKGVRAIEELTKEVMRPIIREWLDENLPSLVERLVGREIERLTREAEETHQG